MRAHNILEELYLIFQQGLIYKNKSELISLTANRNLSLHFFSSSIGFVYSEKYFINISQNVVLACMKILTVLSIDLE